MGAEAAPMSEREPRLIIWERVVAGLAEPDAAHAHIADDELPAHEVVKRHTAGDDVAARILVVELVVVVALKRFDRLRLDERHLAARRVRVVGERAGSRRGAGAL